MPSAYLFLDRQQRVEAGRSLDQFSRLQYLYPVPRFILSGAPASRKKAGTAVPAFLLAGRRCSAPSLCRRFAAEVVEDCKRLISLARQVSAKEESLIGKQDQARS